MANKNLANANKQKNDEFYTQLEDIERELCHYKEHFKNKTILCNCDDPRISNFFKYFALNFNNFGLKKIISTCYKNQDVDLFSQNDSEKAVFIEYTGNPNDPTSTDFSTMQIRELKGDGDFRSEECIKLLKEADIVVTNPPFSLFREYVAQLIKYNKNFIIVGHQNALTYKEIFPLIKDNKMWLGYGFKGGAAHFINNHYIDYATAGNHKEGMIRVSGVVWFTNLDIKKRHEELILYKEYTPNEYPKYDNYDAINVNKTSEIPKDYYENIGVPITFFDKYNPEQFEIIGLAPERSEKMINKTFQYINAIQHNEDGTVQSGNKVNDGPTILYKNNPPPKFPWYTCENRDGFIQVLYARILIRRKK